jgi:hypothetical protein
MSVYDWYTLITINWTPWHESASELYRPTDLRLSTNLVPTFADRGCNVVSVTTPYGRIVGFLDRRRYFFFQVAPQLYWVDPVPLLRKSGIARNRIRASGIYSTRIPVHYLVSREAEEDVISSSFHFGAPHSNLDQSTVCSDKHISWFSSLPPVTFRDSALNSAAIGPFNNLSNSLSFDHLEIHSWSYWQHH